MKVNRYYSCGISPVNGKLCWEMWDRKEGKKIVVPDAEYDQLKSVMIERKEVKSECD